MSDFLNWLSVHSEVLVVVVVQAILTWAFFVSAFVWVLINGGKASLWPPGIKVRTRGVGGSAKLKIEVDTEEMPRGNEAFYKDVTPGQKGARTLSVPIKYTVPIKKQPQIFLALKTIDVGGSATGLIDRLRLKTEAEQASGFTLVFETWNDSIVYGATAATWIAFGE